jgi:hypothetical protein
MTYFVLCVVVFLSWATLEAGEPLSCVTKVRALIGITEARLQQAFALQKDGDEAALQVMITRGQVIRADPGMPLRAEESSTVVVRVRRPGDPETYYTFKPYLDCQK